MEHENDNISEFFFRRSLGLDKRFPGHYRAIVVETNDPLNIGRVRFKCPEMHDYDIDDKDCPWAVPCLDMGGKKAGRFMSPVIGDYVWITFEKQHPYGPIWVGFADPTRRKNYTYPQISSPTPVPVNPVGEPIEAPDDFDLKYLPKDGRPMAHGWVDRYGNMDISSSVGFFPSEHDVSPVVDEADAVTKVEFEQSISRPAVNDPDKKYMARVTKYGHVFLMGDQGYHWKKEEKDSNGDENHLGEFYGEIEKDEKFETRRYLYLQRLLNDDIPKFSEEGGDQRKILMMTRYGSRFEMRDVGWAQLGPIESRSREDEFGESRILSKETEADHRWIKIRSKGGMLIQTYDKGFHPDRDEFIKRSLLEESGEKSEKEDLHWGKDKDARWIRIVTRHGFKIVLDDRGSDPISADVEELPRGNGILLKGRRSPGAKGTESTGDERGFVWEFNENDLANHTTWATPMGNAIEMNDRYQYTMIAATMGKEWVPEHKGIAENEFIRKPMMLNNPEFFSHHLKLDHENEYIRLKTRGGAGPAPQSSLVTPGVDEFELNQGFEARDGDSGQGPWVELVDCQERGFWFSKKQELGVWRAKRGSNMFQAMDDRRGEITIYNGSSPNGLVVLYSNGAVQIMANSDIQIQSSGDVNIRAGGDINLWAGRNVNSRKELEVNQGLNVPTRPTPKIPSVLSPDDRGAVYNGPFFPCPIEEVEHRIEFEEPKK